MSKRSLKVLLASAVIALMIPVAVFSIRTPGKASGILKPADTKTVALGADIYKTNCASCHGANLEGQPNWKQPLPDGLMPAPPHDETGHTWHHADQLLVELTKFGLKKFAGADYKTNMPAYEGVLTDKEIIAVLSFIKSRWPDAVRAQHDSINKRFAEQQKSD